MIVHLALKVSPDRRREARDMSDDGALSGLAVSGLDDRDQGCVARGEFAKFFRRKVGVAQKGKALQIELIEEVHKPAESGGTPD